MRFSLVALAATGLAGCESAKETLGLTKQAPDEFAVYRRAPLSVPPEFNLRPPEPGASSSTNIDPRKEARQALTGGARIGTVRGSTPGLDGLLRRTGADQAQAGIRDTINKETTVLAEEDKTFTEKLMFWDKDMDKSKIVDPTKENKRIQENQALGKPVNEGETPDIERKSKGLLEGIFK
jgi:hypothetical protein